MEKTNWIEKIKEIVYTAMNKGLKIRYDLDEIKIWTDKYFPSYIIEFNNNRISLKTPKGFINIFYSITDRDDLELRTLLISIKEYQEDMAISELEEFISNKEEKEKITDIDNLDDDD
jgi:hypothetical protein